MAKIIRWLPAFVMMTIIFIFSSIPGQELPRFGILDLLVKKSGHAVVYALLGLAFAHAFEWNVKRFWLSWFLTFLFAASDEFHQSFTPGRNAWWVDVALDSTAAALALWILYHYREKLPSKSAGGKA